MKGTRTRDKERIQTFKSYCPFYTSMKKYKVKEVEYELEDKDFLLITAIDNLATEIQKARIGN